MSRTMIHAALLGALCAAPLATAGEVAGERYSLDGLSVTVYLHPFLTEDEAQMLRLVGQNRDALSLFVPEGARFAALALAPEEGFIRDGMPVDSAVAITDLPDVAAARSAALEACNAARTTSASCVVSLDIMPE